MNVELKWVALLLHDAIHIREFQSEVAVQRCEHGEAWSISFSLQKHQLVLSYFQLNEEMKEFVLIHQNIYPRF